MNSCKKSIKTMLIIILMFIIVSPSIVFAEEPNYTITGLNNDGEVFLDFDENRTKTISIDSTEGYSINIVGYYDSNMVVISKDGNDITITPKMFGYTLISLQIVDADSNFVKTEYVIVNIDADNYLNYISTLIPESVNQNYAYSSVLNKLNKYISITSECSGDTCVFSLSKRYQQEWQGDGYILDKLLTKEVSRPNIAINSNEYIFSRNKMSITIGNTTGNKTNLLNKYYQQLKDFNYDNILYVSLDNAIATIDETGVIKSSVNEGTTKVRAYNINDFYYAEATVMSRDPEHVFSNIQEYVNSKSNKTINIDASTINYIGDSLKYTEYLSTYINGSDNDFHNELSEDYASSYTNNFSCTSNVCSYSINYYNNGSINTYTVTNVTVNVSGIYLNDYSYNINLNYSCNLKEVFNYKIYNLDESQLTYNYDSNYISIEDGNVSFIKAGTTYFEIESNNGYKKRVPVVIVPSNLDTTINTYVNSFLTINLPYTLSNIDNNLAYLEGIVMKYITSLSTFDNIKEFVTVDVKCIDKNQCLININRLGNTNYNSVAAISYDSIKTYNANEMKELESSIESTYVLSLDETMSQIKKYSLSSNEFYQELYKLTNINDLINNSDYDVELTNYKKITEFNSMFDYVEYDVVVSKDSNFLLSKHIIIRPCFIINMSFQLKRDNETRLTYIKDTIENITKESVTVELTGNNIYSVTLGSKTFNIILDQKPKININSFNITKRSYDLSVGDTYKIEYNVYPENANNGVVSFKSSNEDVLTIDSEGNITAIAKGYAFIKVSSKTCNTVLLAVVDTDFKTALNDFVPKNNNYIIDYSALRWSTKLDAIRNAARQISSNEFSWIIDYDVTEENNEFFIQSVFTDYGTYPSTSYYSDAEAITYQMKGIDVKQFKYEMAVGDTEDIEIEFTEGDINNLIFESEDPAVAIVDKKGKVTAVGEGITFIVITDKYNNYYNYVSISVNYLNYISGRIEELKDEQFTVNVSYSSNFDTEFSNIINSSINFSGLSDTGTEDYYYQFSNTCDEENETCTLRIYKIDKDSNESTKIIDETFNVKFRGIFIDNFYDYSSNSTLEVGEEFNILYRVFDENKNVTFISSDDNICTVDSTGTVTGVSKGICDIRVTNGTSITNLTFTIDIDKIISDTQTVFDGINNTIHLKMDRLVRNENTTEQEEYEFYSQYYYHLTSIICEELGITMQPGSLEEENNTDGYYYRVETDSYDDIYTNDDISMYISIGYVGWWDDGKPYYISTDIKTNSKIITVVFDGLSDEETDKKVLLDDAVPETYELTLEEYLKYKLDCLGSSEFHSLLDYTEFKNNLKEVCPTCIYVGMGAGGDENNGYIAEYNQLLIIDNGTPLLMRNIKSIAKFDIMLSEAITSEEEYIELLKNEVRTAYLEAKNSSITSSAKLYAIKRFGLFGDSAEELEVNVTKSFDVESGKKIYNFEIEGITFATPVNTIYEGEYNYTYSVTGIEANKNSVELEIGDTEDIVLTFTPNNATDKTYTATSSNNNVATVSENTITAVGGGTAYITLKSNDGDYTTVVNITVNGDPLVANIDGDVNLDGLFNIQDVIALRRHLAGLQELTSDGLATIDVVDREASILDLILLRKALAN